MTQLKFFGLIGSITKNGKKTVAYRIIDDVLNDIAKELNISTEHIQAKIEKKLSFHVEVRTVKRGKRVHIIPVPMTRKRQKFLIRKWLLSAVRENRKKLCFKVKLKAEILDILLRKRSGALSKRRALFKLVNQNRANAHFRW